MRTNVVLDDKLVKEAKKLTGIKTKKAVLHEALLVLIESKKKKSLLDLVGKIEFYENFDYKKLRNEIK